jgi:Ca-activated chloride channel family protein
MRQSFAVLGYAAAAVLASGLLWDVPLPAAQLSGGRSSVIAVPPPLEADLTVLTVTVANKSGAVNGLSKNQFQVLEDGVEQKISYFWIDNRPLSVGFVMDGSMYVSDTMMEVMQRAGPAFLKSKTPQDEFFVVVFADVPAMVVSYTYDSKLMPRTYPSHGESLIYDAIYNGIDAMKEAANPRKVLLVVTAGGGREGNGGKKEGIDSEIEKGVSDQQLTNLAIKEPVQIYSINMGGPTEVALELDLLAGLTGGLASMSADSAFTVEAMCNEWAQALKTQYLIGYKSTNSKMDGHRRGVKVTVRSPESSPKLTVWTKSGYYAEKELKRKSTASGR